MMCTMVANQPYWGPDWLSKPLSSPSLGWSGPQSGVGQADQTPPMHEFIDWASSMSNKIYTTHNEVI